MTLPSGFTVPTATPPQARRIKKTEMAGKGCLIQAVGLAIIGGGFVFWPLFIPGVVLLIYGSAASVRYVCSACGNRLEEKGATMCPTCHATLGP